MGKANKISSKHPIFSGLTAAFGIASLASFVSSGTVPTIADYIAAAGDDDATIGEEPVLAS